MPWIYLLHLDKPLHHARHYAGCTTDLTQRLITHATGHGSHLTRHLYLIGIGWTLGGIYQAKEGCNLRAIERILKDQKHGPRYCTLCTGRPQTLPGTTIIPVAFAPVQSNLDAIAELARRQAAPQDGSLHRSK